MNARMQSLGWVISSRIMQEPDTDDGGGAPQGDDPNKMAADWTESVYQIGPGTRSDKAQRIEIANIAAALSQKGAATMHAEDQSEQLDCT